MRHRFISFIYFLGSPILKELKIQHTGSSPIVIWKRLSSPICFWQKEGVTRSRVSNDDTLPNHTEISKEMSPASVAPVIMLYFCEFFLQNRIKLNSTNQEQGGNVHDKSKYRKSRDTDPLNVCCFTATTICQKLASFHVVRKAVKKKNST
jgi:hypothetical protein